MKGRDNLLHDWRQRALRLETEVKKAIIGQDRVVRLACIAAFARGHVLLEGDVGVGKTTLLRALARCIGGGYERIEGTVDLMPSDLAYYAYVTEDGKPRVEHGPLLKHGEALSIFFFNEINRARPQVHALMLRVMAERSITAFNREFHFPHLQVFADRNRVEKDETFEVPPAARDRFLLEITVEVPDDRALLESLMIDPRFHDADALVEAVEPDVLPYQQLAEISRLIQEEIRTTEALRHYALDLCGATREPEHYGISIDGAKAGHLIQAGASPRGMSMLLRAARVAAWLEGRSSVSPEDLRDVYAEAVSHRVFFTPVYELRRSEVAPELVRQIMNRVAAP